MYLAARDYSLTNKPIFQLMHFCNEGGNSLLKADAYNHSELQSKSGLQGQAGVARAIHK
jgi:hypothetical protein